MVLRANAIQDPGLGVLVLGRDSVMRNAFLASGAVPSVLAFYGQALHTKRLCSQAAMPNEVFGNRLQGLFSWGATCSRARVNQYHTEQRNHEKGKGE